MKFIIAIIFAVNVKPENCFINYAPLIILLGHFVTFNPFRAQGILKIYNESKSKSQTLTQDLLDEFQ